MNRETADKVIGLIEDSFQERRNTEAMETETHNRELERVNQLKAKIEEMVETPAPSKSAK
jgi:hypothetical protein